MYKGVNSLNNMLSRNERLWEKLEAVAEGGRWSYQTTMYPSEIRRIQRQWNVNVQNLRTENNNMISVLITWNNAFHEGMNFEQSWYISGLLDEMPQVETPAQRLFLITART